MSRRHTVLWGSTRGCQFGGAEDRRRERVLRSPRVGTIRVRLAVHGAREFAASMARIQRALAVTPEECERLKEAAVRRHAQALNIASYAR